MIEAVLYMATTGPLSWMHGSPKESQMRNIEAYNEEVKKLAERVAVLQTVEQSAIALIHGLRAQINQLIVESDGIVSTEALQKLSSAIDVSTQSLAAAVSANTVVPSGAPATEGTTGGEGDPGAPEVPETKKKDAE